MAEVLLERRLPTPEEHRLLAEAVGWAHAFDWNVAPLSLLHSLFGVVALDGDRAVGMGRLVGDGVLYFYVQDVAVDPAYQGRGIGQMIVEALLAHIRDTAITPVFVGLFASADAIHLYHRNGFTEGDITGMFRLVHPASDEHRQD